MVCDHVIIIHGGKVAKAPAFRTSTRKRVGKAAWSPSLRVFSEEQPSLHRGETLRAKALGATTLRLEAIDPPPPREIYRRPLATIGKPRIRPDRPTLEDVFVQITGRD
jgi:hypothetical protein